MTYSSYQNVRHYRIRLWLKRIAVIAGLFLIIAGPTTYFITTHPNQSDAAWYNEGWKFRKKITIDDTQVSGAGNLTNFPVLVKFSSDADLAAKAQSDGDDILFTDSTGTKLDHEIETFSSTSGALVAWVEVPTLNGAAVTELFMYYGNVSASNQQNASGTWNSEYTGVWHAKETPTGSANDIADSTSNAVHTTSTSMDSTNQVTGVNNGSLLFDGSTEYTSRTSVPQTSTTNYTLQAWVKLSAITQLSLAVYNGNDSGGYGFGVGNGGGAGGSVLSGLNGGVAWLNSSYTFAAIDTWYHIVMTRDTTTTRFYVNGAQTAGTSTSTPNAPSSRFSIGNELNGANSPTRYFGGTIDEVRISNTNRSADWITTEYNNQSSPTTFFTVGNQTTNPTVLYWALNEGTGTSIGDTSNNANTGTISGATWDSAGRSNTPGDFTLKFDGSNDVVSRTYSGDTELDPGTTSMSVSGWFRHAATISGQDTLLARYTSTGGYKVYMKSTGVVCFGIDDDSSWATDSSGSPDDEACSTGTYNDSKWHFVEGVKSTTSSITLYIDGQQVGQDASLTGTGSISGSSPTFYVGIDANGTSNPWDGFIDEVKIYQTARSVSEVKADFIAKGSVAGSAATFGANDVNTATALTNGLTGWWKMDESSWTVNCSTESVLDSSGNANDGEACPNSTGPTGGNAGKFSYGGTVDGSNDYIAIDDVANLEFSATQDFAVSFWVLNGSSNANGDAIIEKWDGSGGYPYVFRYTTANSVTFNRYDGTNNPQVAGTTLINDSVWHHIVGTKVGTTLYLYIDGVLQTSSTDTTTGTTTNSSSLYFGARGGSSQFYNGTLDDVRVYNRAFSAKDVRDLYAWAPGPVGYWKLDERTGTTAADSSGNGLSGTLESGPTWSTGKYGSAVNFDGSNDEIDMGDVSSLDFAANQDFTFSAWFNTTTTASKAIVSKWDGNGAASPSLAYHMLINTFSGNKVSCSEYSGGSAKTATSTTSLNDGQWHFVSCVRSGTTMYIYVNGKQENSTGSAGGSVTNSANFTIGGVNGTSILPFPGRIDDVKVYNYARTTKQVVEDMSAGHPAGGSIGGIMRAHWKMDEMTGQTLNDSSGNGNSGTLGDTTSSASDDPAWGAGKYNGGLVMDATGEFADGVTATALGFPTATNAFTISLWVKTTGSSEYYLFDNCSSCGRDVSLRMDNGRVETLIHDGTNGNGTPQYGVASSYNNGAWHYIALTWNGAGMETVYANGKRLGSTTSTSVTGSLETSAQFRIGSRNGGPSNFTGSMDEVKVYNYDLSPDEIMVDYNQGKAAVLGSLSTESDGTTTSFSSSREYCVPGSTATCTPPIGEWKLNEGTGTSAFDTSGNGSTGTLTSTPVWAAGKYGKGVKMNGTSDYINLSHPTALNATTTFTLSAWVNASSNIAGAGIIEEAFAGGGDRIQYGIGFGLDDGTDNKLQVGFYDGGGWALAEDSTAFTTGVWTHVEGTWDGTILRLYKNGIQVATNTPGRSTATDTEDIRIGARHDTAGTVDFFPGTIDEVRIFNVTRTPAEVAWDYNRGGPVAWYQFDECTGDTIYDSSGNGLSGTLVYSTGANDAAGTCTSGDTTEMRYNGRNGKFNAGMDFDGTNDYFTVADNAALDMGSQMTFTGWFNVNNTSTTRPIIAKASEYLVRFETDDNFNFFLYDGTDYEPRLTAAVAPSAGEWHHFAAVFDSTLGSNQQKLYIDGKLSAQQDRTLTIAATTNTFRNEFFGDVFDGLLDDIRVYRYPLTEAQIKLVINENSAVRFGPITGSP